MYSILKVLTATAAARDAMPFDALSWRRHLQGE